MADYGNYADPFASTQPDVGEGRALGNIGPGNPLYDWYSQLSPDDLAKFVQDPQRAAAQFAAEGKAPPSPEAMANVHHVNTNVFNTPTGPQPDQGPASPLEPTTRGLSPRQAAGAGAMDQRGTGIDPVTGRVVDAFDPKVYMYGGNQNPRLGGNKPDTTEYQENVNPRTGGRKPVTMPEGPTIAPKEPGGTLPPLPAGDNLPATLSSGFVPRARPAAAPPRPAVAAPAPEEPIPTAVKPPGEDLNPKQEGAKKPEEKTALEKAGSAISDLGKAMQGVKAPEALKPPSGGPSVRQHSTIQAPQIQQLLGLASGVQSGQVPPSAMPLLRLMGR